MGIDPVAVEGDDPWTAFIEFTALRVLALSGNTVIGADDGFGANWLSANVDGPQFGGNARFGIEEVPGRFVEKFDSEFDCEFDCGFVREFVFVVVLEVEVDIFVVLRSGRMYKDSRDRLSSCLRSGGRRLAIWL